MKLKDLAAGRGPELLYFDPDVIEEDPDFNLRDMESESTKDHIEQMYQAIMAGGIASFPPVTISQKDGKVVLTAGYCRRRAFAKAKAAGAVMKGVLCQANNMSSIDRVLDILSSNSGLPLTQLEQAQVVKRLLDMGLTQAEISRKVGKSQTAIANLITLLNAPESIKDLVQKGEISSTFVVEEIKANPGEAEEKITKAVKKAKDQGKKKATKKDIESDDEVLKPCPFCGETITEIAGEGEFEHPLNGCILEAFAFGMTKITLWNKRGK